jgi:enolase
LRDEDAKRYRGLGCRKAVALIKGELNGALAGVEFAGQAELDRAMVSLDGTPNKARLGANAILAVSIAFARACSLQQGVPLYRGFAKQIGREPAFLPRLTINLFSGAKHAGGQVPIQDVLLIPLGARNIDATLSATYEVYQTAAELMLRRYGMRLLTADEGGLAPPCSTVEEMLDLAVDSIRTAGYSPGEDMFLGVDVASSHFYQEGVYRLGDRQLRSSEMIARISQWANQYPIISVEDGLAEDDWQYWPDLRQALTGKALVVGDDLLCTNPDRIRRAVEARACNALLLKVNQIGTLTEAAEARRLARDAGWRIAVSVRSGETEDDWAADLAVGWRGDQFKNGSITQSERLSKYNRLLAIEEETRWPVRGWPGRPA